MKSQNESRMSTRRLTEDLSATQSAASRPPDADGRRDACDISDTSGPAPTRNALPATAPQAEAPCPMDDTCVSRMGSLSHTPPTSASADPGSPQVAGFRILGRLGRDGQGEVLLAYDEKLAREVALKIPHGVGAESGDAFLREARALAKVHHPNIVGIHSFGRCGERFYFTMDRVEGLNVARIIQRLREKGDAQNCSFDELMALLGVDLAAVGGEVEQLRKFKRPYFRLVALWMAQVADGLATAQRRGVLHRDIKPANLILASDGRMVVVDFGLARSLRAMPSPRALGVTGTLPYVAPERAAGDWARVDHRADIWALGATLYELLTYQRAFPRRSREVLVDIITKDPEPLRELRPEIPEELERICLKSMRHDPDQRYSEWPALAADLRHGLYRRRRVLKRRTFWSLLAGAAIVMPTLGVILGPSLWARVCERRPDPVDTGVEQETVESLANPLPLPDDVSRPLAGALPAADAGAPAMSAPEDSARARVLEVPLVLLALNQDLNGDDAFAPEAGGEADALFRRRLAEQHWEARDAAQPPAYWTLEQALHAAREAGATLVVFGEFTARLRGKTTDVVHEGDTVYRWNLRMRVRVIRVSDGRAFAIPTASDEVAMFANHVERDIWTHEWEAGPGAGASREEHKNRHVEAPLIYDGDMEKVRLLANRQARAAMAKIDQLIGKS